MIILALVLMVSEKWVSSCTRNPDYCQQKIVAMTVDETKQLHDADAAAADAYKKYQAIEETRDALAVSIVKAHHMDKFPAAVDRLLGFEGGTCMGSIKFNKDGYIVYTPSSDISQCGDYK